MSNWHQLRHFSARSLIALSLSVGCGGRAMENSEPDGSGGASQTKGGRSGATGGRSMGGSVSMGGSMNMGGSVTSGGGSGTGGEGGCVYGKFAYEVGQMFQALDGCNSCVCYEGGSVGCTTIACPNTCNATESAYSSALTRAKECNPTASVNQCWALYSSTLRCACPTFVNPDNTDVFQLLDELSARYTQNSCNANIICDCAQPTGGFCNALGQCEDTYDTGGASCLVEGIVYPNGASGIKDPFSCNLCECFDGNLGCTDIGCDRPCPADTIAAGRCVQCGPSGDCSIIETGCITPCVGDCVPPPNQVCIGGICQVDCR